MVTSHDNFVLVRRHVCLRYKHPFFALALAAIFLADLGAEEGPIAIADLNRDTAVDFDKEILPIFRKNCLACHSSSKKEGGLVLETPESIRKGGSSGPAVVPGKPLESNLLLQASRRQESYMPPSGNDVGAKPLTPEELGLIQLWIKQGAEGAVSAKSEKITWQPLPPGVNAIYALAMTPDGRFVAAARANQVFLYHVPSGRHLGRLTDPKLLEMGIYSNPGIADLDAIQSLSFSADGQRLVSGGYRTAKVWKRQSNVQTATYPKIEGSISAIAVSPDATWCVVGEASGQVRVVDLASRQVVATGSGHAARITGLAVSPDSARFASVSEDGTWCLWQRDGQKVASIAAPCPLAAICWPNLQTLVTGGADNQLHVWLWEEAVQQAASQGGKATPAKTLAGHSQPITCLAKVADHQVLSGSSDGTLRLWDIAEAKQLRQANHGQPVSAIATTASGQLWASASTQGQNVKVWNGTDGAQLQELRGDHRLVWKQEVAARQAALAKRLVDVAQSDVNQAKERLKSEENNQKQADDEMKKAAEELAKKTEAAKEPVAKKEVAEKELAEVQAAIAQAEQQKPKDAEAVAAAQKAQQEAEQKAKAAADALAVATKNLEAAEAEHNAAKEAAEKEPDNGDLSAAAKAAEEKRTKAVEAKKAAEAAKQQADELLTTARNAVQAAMEKLKKTEEMLAAAQAKLKPAEEKVKQLAPAAQKALDEQMAAQRAFESAERAAKRAAEAVERAKQAIPPLEEIVQAKQQALQQAETKANEAKQAAAQATLAATAIAFAPDDLTLAAACQDQSVRLFDARSGSPWDVVETPVAVQTIAFAAPMGLIAAGTDGSLAAWKWNPEWVWERTLGDVNDPTVFVDRVTAVDIDADGRLLAAASGEPSRSGEILLWNLESGQLVRRIADAHTDEIFTLRFSRDGQFIASSSADRFVKVFEVASGRFVRSFEGHTHHVLGVAWSADGRQLATSGADKVIKVWNTVTGDQLRTIQGFGKEVTAIHYVGDTDQVVASCGDASVQVKNTSNGGNVRNLGGASDYVYAVAVSADGQLVAAGGQDSIVRVWRADGNLAASFPPP